MAKPMPAPQGCVCIRSSQTPHTLPAIVMNIHARLYTLFLTFPIVQHALQGIAKLDLLAPRGQKECAVASIEYADGGRGGEAFFVPRSQDPQQSKGEQTGCGLDHHQRALEGSLELQGIDCVHVRHPQIAACCVCHPPADSTHLHGSETLLCLHPAVSFRGALVRCKYIVSE